MREQIEQEILDLMGKHDQRFVGLLYDHYSAGLYGLACQIVRDDSMARDVIQDSFIKIWKRYREYEPSRAKLFTWIYQIVRNTAIDKRRSIQKRGDREIQMDVPDVTPMGYDAIIPEHTDVPEHLQNLEEKYRDVLNLLFYKGMTQQEASDFLNVPLGTVKTRLKIGLREMRKVFSNDQLIALFVACGVI